ncbi:hypothetical protein PYCC9005_000147 [Savitreella phatthalungensis]
MCKHILNAQVSIRAPCCKGWYDCAECHAEATDHPLMQKDEMSLICKKCRRAFRLDAREFEEDESKQYCPHCDNHFYREAKTPHAALVAENQDVREDNRLAQLRDLRMKMIINDDCDGLFDDVESSARLG